MSRWRPTRPKSYFPFDQTNQAIGGISIPASYTAHISPIASSRHHTDLLRRVKTDDNNPFETPYVVWLQAYDHIATVNPAHQIQQLWEFKHPNPHLSTTGNTHNKRQAIAKFRTTTARGKINGIAGYFEAVLYKDVELSTRPDHIDLKSRDMFSWFPAYFPLKQPFWVPDGETEIDVYFWRHTDGRKVWYEWCVEGYFIVPGGSDGMDNTVDRPVKRVKYGMSEIHNLSGRGSNMVIT